MMHALNRRSLLIAGLAAPAALATAGPAFAADPASGPSDGDTRITDIPLKDATEQGPEEPGTAVPTTLDSDSGEVRLAGAPSRRAEAAATMVACTWNGQEPDAIEVRSLSAQSEWSDWVRLVPIADPSSPGTEPAWIGPASAVDVRASRGGADVTTEVTAHLIATSSRDGDDQLTEPSGGAGSSRYSPLLPMTTPTQAGYLSPTVYSRSDWGCDESLARTTSAATELKAAVVHHTEGTNSYTEAQSAQIVRGIYTYHTQTQGWADIGYNLLVDKFGRVFEGRKGGLEKNIIGAHARGFNTGSVGIAVMGSHMSTAVPAATLEMVAQLIAWKLNGVFRGSPTETDTFHVTVDGTRYSNGSTATLPRVFSHRDVNYTDCPGDRLWANLNDLRNRARELMSDAYHGHLDAFNAAGGRAVLGSVTAIAKVEGDYEVTRLTKGIVLSQSGGPATAYVTSFGSSWVPSWGRPLRGGGDAQVFENGVATRTNGTVTFSEGQLFTDVPTSHMYVHEISAIAEKGITTGWDDGTFRPDAAVARDAMLVFLYRALGSPAFTAPAASPFSDITPATQYYKEMTWAYERGYATGWDTGGVKPEIRPLAPVARDAMAAFLYRAAGADASAPGKAPFTDVSTTNMYATEIAWMKTTGISTGWPDGTYRPQVSTIRSDMAAFLVRWLNVI